MKNSEHIFPGSLGHMTILLGMVIVVIALTGIPADAQEAENPPAADTPSEISSTIEEMVVDDDVIPQPNKRWLLREGARLVEVEGWLRLDPQTNHWQYHISETDPDAPGYVLFVLPCMLLNEMVTVVKSMMGAEVEFVATGEVYVYENQNYFLPTHPPRVIRVQELYTNATSETQTTTKSDEQPPERSEEESAESLMRELDTAVQGKTVPILRGSSATSRSEYQEDVESKKLLAEGTVLLSRRGVLSRSVEGAWTFVLDADSTGLVDPPLHIMPCLLLENLKNYINRRGRNAPVLLSGHVYVYDRNNYIMPRTFRIPREYTQLAP